MCILGKKKWQHTWNERERKWKVVVRNVIYKNEDLKTLVLFNKNKCVYILLRNNGSFSPSPLNAVDTH